MGALIRELMEEQKKDSFFKNLIFSKELLPKLMLLGTLEYKEVPTDDGKVFAIDIIHYEGKQYIMKHEYVKRWFDE